MPGQEMWIEVFPFIDRNYIVAELQSVNRSPEICSDRSYIILRIGTVKAFWYS